MKNSFQLQGNDQTLCLFNELLVQVKKYNTKCNIKALKKAFKIAQNTHSGQYRDSGEPYLTHPLEVALILADYQADEDTLIAAILHDTVEDTNSITTQILKKQFGNNVAQLVEGVTKIDEFLPDKKWPQQTLSEHDTRDIETIRKVFKKTKQDVRIIFIKLADRLHNLRTLGSKKDYDKQLKKAQESLSIFMKIAARLGMWKMKREFAELCFPYVYPKEYIQIQQSILEHKTERKHILNATIAELKKADKEKIIIDTLDYNRSISHLHTILESKKKLTINDNLAIQIIVKDEDSCYLALRLIHTIWENHSHEHDYIAHPRDDNYRAYHTVIITPKGHRIELRIMTEAMYLRNIYGLAYSYFFDRQNTPPNFLHSFDEINNKTQGRSEEFLEAAKTDLLESKIRIFSKGKGFKIPLNSTALDFAFFAYPKIALNVKNIFINEQESAFSTLLKEGDVLEIIADKKITVNFSWFQITKTATARIAIQEALKQWDHERKIMIGQQILQKEFDLYEYGRIETAFKRHEKELRNAFLINKQSDIYILIAEGNIQTYEVIKICFPSTKKNFWKKILSKFDKFFEKLVSRGEGEQMRLKIEGILDSSVECIQEIYKIRQTHVIDLIKSNLKEDKNSNTFSLQMRCQTYDKTVFHYFFVELEKVTGIIRTMPMLSYQKRNIFVLLVVLTLTMWSTLPTLLSQSLISEVYPGRFLGSVLLYFNLIPVVIINYLLYSFIRNFFSQIRNSAELVFTGMFLNLIGIAIFSWQIIKHDLKIDFFIILAIFFGLTFIFLYQYLNQRLIFQTLSNEKIERRFRKNNPKKILIGYTCGILSTVIWGINPIMIRHLVSNENMLMFSIGMRLYMGSIFLMIVYYFLKISGKYQTKQAKVKYNLHFWLIVFGLVGNFLFFHWGLKFTTATNANLMENFAPIIILIVMGLLIPNISHQIGTNKVEILKTFIIAFIGSIGASLILSHFPVEVISDYRSKLFGDFIEIIAMIFFAVFIIGSNLYMKQNKVSSVQLTGRALFIAALIFTPFIFLEPIPTLNQEQWFWLSMIGIVSTGTAYTLWNLAAKSLNVIPASLLLNFTIIVTLIVENQVSGLPFSYLVLIGAAFMVFASINAELLNIKRRQSI